MLPSTQIKELLKLASGSLRDIVHLGDQMQLLEKVNRVNVDGITLVLAPPDLELVIEDEEGVITWAKESASWCLRGGAVDKKALEHYLKDNGRVPGARLNNRWRLQIIIDAV